MKITMMSLSTTQISRATVTVCCYAETGKQFWAITDDKEWHTFLEMHDGTLDSYFHNEILLIKFIN